MVQLATIDATCSLSKRHQVCTLGKKWNASIKQGVSLELYWVKATSVFQEMSEPIP